MLPKKHFIFGLVASIVFYFLIPSLSLLEIIIFFFSSVLIDFDHYLYFLYKKKSFNLKKAYFYFRKEGSKLHKKLKEEQKKYYTGIYIFHGIELVAINLVLGYFLHKIFYMVALGMFFHLILDWIQKIGRYEYPRKYSILYDLILSRNKKKI